MIKYVAILGYCYSSCSLVDMRIHDINVVADLNRHDPAAPDSEEPAELDGTAEGVSETAESSPAVQHIVDSCVSVWNHVTTWWEGWWPRLHMSVSFSTPAGCTGWLHVSVSLLFDLRLEDCDLDTPVADKMSAASRDAWVRGVAAALEAEGAWEDMLRSATDIMGWIFAGVSMALAVLGLGATGYAATIAAATAVWLGWLNLIIVAYEFQLVSVEFLVGLLAMWFNGIGNKAVTLALFAIWMSLPIALRSTQKTWKWLGARILWGVVSLVYQFAVACASFYLFAMFVEVSMSNFAEA